MSFIPGIQTINTLATTQTLNSSITPVNVQNSATDGFFFNLPAGKKLYWEVTGLFSTGATGGFRFLAHNTSAPTTYNAQFAIVDLTTAAPAGTPYNFGQTTEAAVTNASAVATNYNLNASGFILANLATVFSFQFAQNNSTANNISMLAGMCIKFWQL